MFGGGSEGIFRVSPKGGAPEQLVSVGADELAHGPQILPGGKFVLFTLATGTDAGPVGRRANRCAIADVARAQDDHQGRKRRPGRSVGPPDLCGVAARCSPLRSTH